MANWKKIISSGSKAHLLNVTASGGINIGTLTGGTAGTDDVLVRDTATGEIKYVTQQSIGNLGASVNAFATMSAGGTEVYADTSTDDLNFAAGNNVGIVGNNTDKKITFSAVTKSIADITTILSASLTDGTHQNITINEPSPGVFSLTGSSNLQVSNGDTSAQNAITLNHNTSNNSLTASLTNLKTSDPAEFADITATGNISASGFISASALHVSGNATIGGDLALDGNFLFDGFNFETSNLLNHSGSNIFGSGSGVQPSALSHQFTGSVSITGSGVTLIDGIFTGDGSGLTNLPASALPSGLLSSSAQIASDISGAYTADGVTISKNGGVFAAIIPGVGSGNAGLATGGNIYTFVTNSIENDLKPFVANNYITSILPGSNAGITGGGTNGAVTLGIDISTLGAAVPVAGDSIAFSDTDDNLTKRTTIATLAGIITASSAGTVTSITFGNGLEQISGNNTINPTVAVDPGNNIQVTSEGVGLQSTIGDGGETITNITATTGSFGKLTVTGDTTIIESETLKINDNFILLNSNAFGTPGGSTDKDAGLSVHRGSSDDANLFWDEQIDRWALSIEDIAAAGTDASADAYLTSVSSSTLPPSSAPDYGTTSGYGNMHIDTDDGEIWIYV